MLLGCPQTEDAQVANYDERQCMQCSANSKAFRGKQSPLTPAALAAPQHHNRNAASKSNFVMFFISHLNGEPLVMLLARRNQRTTLLLALATSILKFRVLQQRDLASKQGLY